MRKSNAHTYGNADGHSDRDGDRHIHAYADDDAYVYSNAHCNSYVHAYADCHFHSNIYGNSDRAWTTGINWYLNRFFKVQLNGIHETIEDVNRSPINGRDKYWMGILRLQFSM